ncbi:MAG: sensor histidine kinase [Geodermatophilaceae bacterium]
MADRKPTSYVREILHHRWAVDALLAMLVSGLALASITGDPQDSGLWPTDIWTGTADGFVVLLLFVGTASVAWRRRTPLVVLFVTGSTFLLFMAVAPMPPPLPFAPLIAVYTVTNRYPARVSTGAAVALAGAVVGAAVVRRGAIDDDFLDYLLLGLAAWALGHSGRLSRSRAALIEQRARHLSREQDAATQRAVEKEKARIAREMHDIIAHHVCVIVAQAAAFSRQTGPDPRPARQALGSIEITAREALTEMRRLLGAMGTEETDLSRRPQPGLEQLPALVSQIERAGLPVELVVNGSQRPLAVGVELNAYRIIQEALTNTLQHAGPARATVELVYQQDVLELRVRDDGNGELPEFTSGRGLIGMRQRAALLGGELAVGPGQDKGIEVMVQLPVAGAPEETSQGGEHRPRRGRGGHGFPNPGGGVDEHPRADR